MSVTQLRNETVPGLLTPSVGYKPFRYPWAHDLWQRQQQVHWLPEEVQLGEDCKDWAARLTGDERELLTQIFRFFTQSDIDVADNYMERYSQVFRPTEVKMMLAAFTNMETIHVAAYSLLVETVGMPDSEYTAFLEYDEMRAKHDYIQRFHVDDPAGVLETLAVFGAFTEGLQLFASFAILLNFPRRGLMKGMGQIVSWSARDETLHCEGIIKLFHAYARETGALTPDVLSRISNHCQNVVELEDAFVDLAFGTTSGGVEGLTADEVKAYVRYVADLRLQQLGMSPIYGVGEHPLPWLPSMLTAVEHANFFETRSTEYSRAATRGSWPETFDAFDAARA